VDATNNLAERVMRTLVMIRKNWGGNRTENGARAQAILSSVLCTARQQDKDVFQLLVDLLRSPQPKLLDILPPEFLDANQIGVGEFNATGAHGAKTQRKSTAHHEHVPLPTGVEVLLPQMQQPAPPPIFSSS
jgi:hypothetical protein